jgi:hypothetical protein
MWGTRGPFLPEVAMVVAVVTPVVFVLRLLKNAIKTVKLVVCKQSFKSLLYIVNLPNTNCSMARAQTTLVQWNPGI